MSPVVAGRSDLLGALRARLALEGLNIVLPVDRPGFDSACVGVGVPLLDTLLKGAAGAVLVGDGGPAFFSRFQAAPRDPEDSQEQESEDSQELDESRDPLDRYTRLRLVAAVNDVVGPGQFDLACRILYPFANQQPTLPFQRLGRAAGLPAPGPLGIQIHPVYGPWWAYRALVVVSASLDVGPVLTASCADCRQPCVTACPAQATSGAGFSSDRCIAHRRLDAACRESCVARICCPVGTAHQYPGKQLAFHMKASFAQIRQLRRSGVST